MKVERNQRDRPAPPVPGASLPGPASGAAPGGDSAAKYYPCINESLTPRGVYCSREQSCKERAASICDLNGVNELVYCGFRRERKGLHRLYRLLGWIRQHRPK